MFSDFFLTKSMTVKLTRWPAAISIDRAEVGFAELHLEVENVSVH